MQASISPFVHPAPHRSKRDQESGVCRGGRRIHDRYPSASGATDERRESCFVGAMNNVRLNVMTRSSLPLGVNRLGKLTKRPSWPKRNGRFLAACPRQIVIDLALWGAAWPTLLADGRPRQSQLAPHRRAALREMPSQAGNSASVLDEHLVPHHVQLIHPRVQLDDQSIDHRSWSRPSKIAMDASTSSNGGGAPRIIPTIAPLQLAQSALFELIGAAVAE